MDRIEDYKDNAKQVINAADKILSFSATTAFKRITFMIVVATLILGAQYGYLNHLINNDEAKTEAYLLESQLLNKKINYKSSSDMIELCLSTLKEQTELSHWYCEKAVEGYRSALKGMPGESDIDELVSKQAYGFMLADLKHKIRLLLLTEMSTRHEGQDKVLAALTSQIGSIALFLSTTTLFLGVVFLLYRRAAHLNHP